MTTTPSRLSPEAVAPLATLDPDAPLDDLAWLDDLVGGARVVALGESSHYNHEFGLLRTRVLRYLVERHGFTAYATESGFTEGRRADAWVRGGSGTVAEAQAAGVTSLFGLWTETRSLLEWLRHHNRGAARPVGFHGIDLPGSQASMAAGLDPVLDYLARADPDYTPEASLRATIAEFAADSAFAMPRVFGAYTALPFERRNAVTAGLADLVARMTAQRIDYIGRTSSAEYERALRDLLNTVALDMMYREVVRGSTPPIHSSIRDRAIADTVAALAAGEERILVTAHNAHIQRTHFSFPGFGRSSTMGMHLAERLGGDYVAIGTTCATGEALTVGEDFYAGRLFEDLKPPEPGSLDAVMAASHDGPFTANLHRLPEADTAVLGSVGSQRIGPMYLNLEPLAAYDAIVHVPHVTAAEPDAEALAHAPEEVRSVFGRYREQRR